MKTDTILIGIVEGAHGVRGEMKIKPLTDDPSRFYDLDEVTLRTSGGEKTYPIELVRLHKGKVLLTLEGVPDRTAVEKLFRAEVIIPKDEAAPLAEDEYYIEDLVGLEVVDSAGEKIGAVTQILQTSGTVDTVVIKTAEKTIYVPARKLYFTGVDIPAGKVTAEIPEDFYTL